MNYNCALFLLSSHRVQASLDSKRIVCLVLISLQRESYVFITAWLEFCPVATVRLYYL